MPVRKEAKPKERDVGDFFNLTGARSNTMRPQEPQLPLKESYYNVTRHADPLNIDLYNLGEPQFEDSKYVLTSPRSLEACSRMGVKPVELLHRPLEEFQEELLPLDVPVRTIYSLYDEQEKSRLAKLLSCREERRKIIEEDGHSSSSFISPLIEQTSSHGDSPLVLIKKSSTREHLVDQAGDHGSLQRRRTAWTTGIGHDRVTPEEIDIRAQELYKEGRRVKDARTITAQSSKTAAEKDLEAVKQPQTVHEEPRTAVAKKPILKSKVPGKKSKQRRQNGSTRSRSMSDITTTSRISRSPWLRDPTADAKPITDTTLRKKLPSARTPGTRITARDQKILELMLAKREEEQKLNHQRQASKLQWEKEREAEGLAKTHEENWRRRSLSDLRRNKEMKRMEVETRKRQEEEAAREERKQAADFSHKQWQMHLQKQKEMREQRAQEKREQNMQRKKSQEKRLEQQRKESEEFIEEVKRHQAATIRRANTMKEVREREQALAKRLANTKVQRRHSEKWDTIKKKSEEEAEQLQQMLEDKHKAVMSNYERMQQRRQEEIKRSQYDLQKKIHRARSAQKTLEEEMAAWYDNLMEYRKQMEDRAQEAAQEAAFLKSKRVQEERIAKLQMQQENLKRMLEQEEEWKNDVEASLALKESRVHMLQREKEEKVEESRQIAQASQRLREELKDQYSEDKLDQMMRRAEIEARIGAGVHSATKNMSTLTLG